MNVPITDANAARMVEEWAGRGFAIQAEAEKVNAPCPHHDLSVRHVVRDLSDTETAYGQCLQCREWLKQTTYFAARDKEIAVEFRPMTAQERERITQESTNVG